MLGWCKITKNMIGGMFSELCNWNAVGGQCLVVEVFAYWDRCRFIPELQLGTIIEICLSTDVSLSLVKETARLKTIKGKAKYVKLYRDMQKACHWLLSMAVWEKPIHLAAAYEHRRLVL